MQTTVEKQKSMLIKRFHTLIGKAGITAENKAIILAQYGVESSKDLDVKDLIEVCNALDFQANPELAQIDRWRKRLMAAVFGWLGKMGKREAKPELVKAIASRAAPASHASPAAARRSGHA